MDRGVHELHLGLPVHTPGITYIMGKNKIFIYGFQNWKVSKIARNQSPKNMRNVVRICKTMEYPSNFIKK